MKNKDLDKELQEKTDEANELRDQLVRHKK